MTVCHTTQPESDDFTLEILMHGVQGEKTRCFEPGSLMQRRSDCKKTGVYEIMDGFAIDDHFFEPSGYSLNAIRKDDYYSQGYQAFS